MGRPLLHDEVLSVQVMLRLTPGQRDKLHALGGPAWLRARIDRAKVSE